MSTFALKVMVNVTVQIGSTFKALDSCKIDHQLFCLFLLETQAETGFIFLPVDDGRMTTKIKKIPIDHWTSITQLCLMFTPISFSMSSRHWKQWKLNVTAWSFNVRSQSVFAIWTKSIIVRARLVFCLSLSHISLAVNYFFHLPASQFLFPGLLNENAEITNICLITLYLTHLM